MYEVFNVGKTILLDGKPLSLGKYPPKAADVPY